MSHAQFVTRITTDPQPRGFIGDLKHIADKIVGRDAGGERLARVFVAQGYGADLVNKSPVLQRLIAEQGETMGYAILEEYRARKVDDGTCPESATLDELARMPLRRDYKPFFDALFALLEISGGGLEIDDYPQWKNAMAPYAAKLDAKLPAALEKAKATLDHLDNARLKSITRDSKERASLLGPESVDHIISVYLFTRKGIDVFNAEGYPDKYTLKALLTPDDILAKIMQSGPYNKALSHLFSESAGDPMMGSAGGYIGTGRVTAGMIDALLNYVRDSKANNLPLVPEISALLRDHPQNLQTLRDAIAASVEEAKQNASVPKGSPAQLFMDALMERAPQP